MVQACGGFFCQPAQPVLQTGESIVFGVNGTQVRMTVQIKYEGPAEGFSWVLPVPFQPKVDVGSDRIFTTLFARTRPTFQLTLPDLPGKPTDSCSEKALEFFPCAFSEAAFGGNQTGSAFGDADGPIILEQGSVGPFDFVILEAAENDPSTVFDWLQDNGYEQPPEAAALLNYYAIHDHVFVALRLQKDAESGDIQPLILEYEMPEPDEDGETNNNNMPIACVPIQLTRIAALDNMPITVYILGNARAVPLNFIELELDDRLVDWLPCNGNPFCYDTDYRDRFDRAASELVNQTFVTEYAGPASIMEGQIAFPLTREQILQVETEQDFVNRFSFLLPRNPLVNGILEEFAPFAFQVTGGGPGFAMDGESEFVFNATALADELDEKVLQPALADQRYVDGFANLTSLYARLGPESMTKDPFFAFKPELPEVDNVHRASSTPVCTEDVASALEITVEQGGGSIVVPATIGGCTSSGWVAPGTLTPVTVTTPVSPAIQLASYGFAGEPGIILTRQLDGTFDKTELNEAILYGDSLVLNQTIPEYTATDATTPTSSSNRTDAPTGTDVENSNANATQAPSAADNGNANGTNAPTSPLWPLPINTSEPIPPPPTLAPEDRPTADSSAYGMPVPSFLVLLLGLSMVVVVV